MPRNGLFIVLEGIDGSGKGTQHELLRQRLIEAGYDVETIDFPRYSQPTSFFVREYLNGVYGTADDVGPYTSSLFFALDRYGALDEVKQALSEGKVVLANRFTASNMAHQGTKFENSEQRRGFYIWLDNLEYEMLGLPRPDMNIILRLSAQTAQKYVDQKKAREYTSKKRDIHEADLSHLMRAEAVYDELATLFPKDFRVIDCERNQELMPKEEVHHLVWEMIIPLLPAPAKTSKSKPNREQEPNPYITKTAKGFSLTSAGREYLSRAVTNIEGNVYAFTDKLSPVTIAAAMARLSRRGDDMRITILDEFAAKEGKDAGLLKRVITAYGDDSVQQLAGLHVVVENASNILTKKLEWGRLAAYLEQSTRYIYYDQKDQNGKYKFFTPTSLSVEATKYYDEILAKIFDNYSLMVHRLTDYVSQKFTVPHEERDIAWKQAVRAQACDAIRTVLPVATKSTVGIFASGQALESLIMHLMSDELEECRIVGQQILGEARKVFTTFLERADKPERGGAWIAHRANTREKVKQLAKKYLSENHSFDTDPVTLLEFWPKNELNLVTDMIYEFSNLSIKEIQNQVESWPIDRKEEVFNSYMGERLNRRHKPGRALEKAHYNFDLLCDYGIFRDLHRHRMVDDLEWQQLTPRYGFDIPELVEEAGLTDVFEECFDLSLKLFSRLQEAGYVNEAQYATLLGHKMRWKLTINAREAFHFLELRTSPQGHPGYRKLALQMYEKIKDVHPLMGEAMKFVNQGEDPELARLAAERYTQFKLTQLS